MFCHAIPSLDGQRGAPGPFLPGQRPAVGLFMDTFIVAGRGILKRERILGKVEKILMLRREEET